ncbi:MAG TPA: response regulator [Vicinamibacterales bacterium]|nr:response regulator [Vicinamibacterales bacterium]
MAPTRVLVLDDNQGIRLGVRLYLEACGFEVLDAADCASALQLLSERAFDVGVLDYSLPDGTALAVLEKIAIVQPDMKAVVLTAYPSESLAETAQRCGALRFLTKPIELGELRLLLDELAGNGATPPGA